MQVGGGAWRLLRSAHKGAIGIEPGNSLRWKRLACLGVIGWVFGTISATGSFRLLPELVTRWTSLLLRCIDHLPAGYAIARRLRRTGGHMPLHDRAHRSRECDGHTRRQFIGQVSAAMAATAVGHWLGPILASGRGSKRVIVVGGGLAGLCAAYELAALGHDVTVLEAQERPGGRVHTLRAPFSDDLYAEAGASRIPTSHDLTVG